MVKLSSSIEDYLETIVMLSKDSKVARVKDISRKLGVKKSSVHSALHVLEDRGLVNHEKYGYIELTRKGDIIGNRIYDSHRILISFLRDVLKVDSRTAHEDACKIEHCISSVTLNRIIDFMKIKRK